jgi:hypothetical protein
MGRLSRLHARRRAWSRTGKDFPWLHGKTSASGSLPMQLAPCPPAKDFGMELEVLKKFIAVLKKFIAVLKIYIAVLKKYIAVLKKYPLESLPL